MNQKLLRYCVRNSYASALNMRICLAGILGLALLSTSSQIGVAQTNNWTNTSNADNDWATGSNWSLGSTTTATETATFDLDQTYNVQLTSDQVADRINIVRGDVTMSGNHRIVLSHDEVLDSDVRTSLTLDGVELESVGASFDGISIRDGATLNFLNGGKLIGGALGTSSTGSGVITFSGSGTFADVRASINGSHDLVVEDGATFEGSIQAREGFGQTAGVADVAIRNTGTSVDVSSLSAGSRGRISISDNAIVDANSISAGSTLSSSGSIQISSGSSLSGSNVNIASGFDYGSIRVNGGDLTSTFRITLGDGTGPVGSQAFNSGPMLEVLSGSLTADNVEVRSDGFFRVGSNAFSNAVASIDSLENEGDILLSGGSLTIGSYEASVDATLTHTGGTLNLTSDETFTLNDSNSYGANRALNLGGSAIITEATQIDIEANAFTANGVRNEGIINVTEGNSILGSTGKHDGYFGNGQLNVMGSDTTVALQDKGFAQLGSLTTLDQSEIIAANGFALGSGGTIAGNGSVSGKFSGSSGSQIFAENGDLNIGDNLIYAGFTTQGEIHAGANVVTINDRNQAKLGSLTTLGGEAGGGTLIADNGAVLDFGNSIVGFGTVTNFDTIDSALIVNGDVIGDSATDTITLEGYVKGVGTFDNVVFKGTFAPGLSPGLVHAGDIFFGDQSVLQMEVGGLMRGSQYDAIDASGLIAVDGTLQVDLINGFNPTDGDLFNLLNFGSLSGEFDNLVLPTLASGLYWNTSQLHSDGFLQITSVPEPSAAIWAALAGCVCLVRRRRQVR